MGYMPVDIFRVTVADLIGESPLGLPIACLQPFYRCHALFYHGITKYQTGVVVMPLVQFIPSPRSTMSKLSQTTIALNPASLVEEKN